MPHITTANTIPNPYISTPNGPAPTINGPTTTGITNGQWYYPAGQNVTQPFQNKLTLPNGSEIEISYGVKIQIGFNYYTINELEFFLQNYNDFQDMYANHCKKKNAPTYNLLDHYNRWSEKFQPEIGDDGVVTIKKEDLFEAILMFMKTWENR